MGGTDEQSNLIALTAREHLLAHLILYKAYPNIVGVKKALQAMFKGSKHQQDYRNFTSRRYTNLRNSLYVKIPEIDDLLYLYNDSKLSFKKISKIYNVSDMTVCKWFKIYNINVRQKNEGLTINMPSKEELSLQLLKDNHPYNLPCQHYNISRSLLYKWLRQYKLVNYRWGDDYPKDPPPIEDVRQYITNSKHSTVKNIKEAFNVGMDRARLWVNSYNLFN